MKQKCTLVFDVGKTNVKLVVLDDQGNKLDSAKKKNQSIDCKPYLSIDVDAIWQWFIISVRKFSQKYQIEAISISTHGATAALVDLESEELLLPIMDYEFDDYPDEISEYNSIRPSYSESYSPNLPAGLNLGKQLYWQLKLLDENKKKRATLLFYPNYWAWRLSGIATTEITSIGCHTDLWNHQTNDFSSLVEKMDLSEMLPKTVPAYEGIGSIKPGIAQIVDLSASCQIYPGVHDSNAGYVPYLINDIKMAPTVISSGTWTIVMSSQAPLDTLNEEKDMLANINILGNSLSTARYMGGREFEIICSLTGASIQDECRQEDVEEIFSSSVMAIPSFIKGCGPYPNLEGKIIGLPDNGKALATVYSALMMDQLLSSLQSRNEIVIEGSFAGNPLLCSLLAALRPSQTIYINSDLNGIIDGCRLLTRWQDKIEKMKKPIATSIHSALLNQYVADWNECMSSGKVGFLSP
ncbi:MAG: FGGY family carbohydrate kinase [Emcibacteraceae bacterium]|nr:FGGY family carbohydrate kinase [Emcibacteraceae bacterium]